MARSAASLRSMPAICLSTVAGVGFSPRALASFGRNQLARSQPAVSPKQAPRGPHGQSPDPFADRAKLPGVRKVIAVASAKGGVGKSSVAVNLALALADAGHRVGLLDADVYGPSVPTMLGLHEQPEVTQDRKIFPVMSHGLQVISSPVEDFSAPPHGSFDAAIQQVIRLAQQGQAIAIHCHAGIGRTGMFAACLARELWGWNSDDAIAWVRQFIPQAVESDFQVRFVEEYQPSGKHNPKENKT